MAVASLEGEALVMMRKKLGKKPYEQAVLAVQHLKENFDEESGKELDKILAEHEDNPANASKKPKASANGKADAVKTPKLSRAERRTDILRRWKAGEIDDEVMEKELAMLEGEVDISTILNCEAINEYPTRSLGEKGNTGWYFRGVAEFGGRPATVNLNIILHKRPAETEVTANGETSK